MILEKINKIIIKFYKTEGMNLSLVNVYIIHFNCL
jgi:hypothetical protein